MAFIDLDVVLNSPDGSDSTEFPHYFRRSFSAARVLIGRQDTVF